VKIVKVKWIDSSIQHGWQEDINGCCVALCDDVGYLVGEDDEKIILARGVSNAGFFNSPLAIPKGCVKYIKEMRLK